MNTPTLNELKQTTNKTIDESLSEIFTKMRAKANKGEFYLTVPSVDISNKQFNRLCSLGFDLTIEHNISTVISWLEKES